MTYGAEKRLYSAEIASAREIERAPQNVIQNEKHPIEHEGVFHSGLERRTLETVDDKRGRIQVEIFKTPNERQYEVVTAEPKQQKSDLPVVYTTPWLTSIRGHNWHTMQDMLELGYPVVMVGPEGGHCAWPRDKQGWKHFIRNLCSISLKETASNMHQILDVTDTYELYRPKEIISIGESRGAMTGMGVNALQQTYDRSVAYSDFLAPCFAQPLRIKNTHELSPKPLLEIASTARLLGKMGLRRFLNYPATVNPNPHYMLHAIASMPTLVSGQAGMLAQQIAPESKIHNTLFSKDRMSQPEAWEEIFKDHHHVINSLRPGGHMALANKNTIRERNERLANLRDEIISSHGETEQINWRAVHLLGKSALSVA